MSAYWVTGDTLETLRQMPAGSIDLVLTSPPFLALRSYLPTDDPAKAQEIGQEGTPGAFLDVLLDITEELRRVLAPHGSIAVELGDTYSGSGGAGGDYAEGGLRDGQGRFDGSASRAFGTGSAPRPPRTNRPRSEAIADGVCSRPERGGPDGWPEAKSLCLIPELYRFALAYGFNPLTGRQCSRWRVRNVVRWVRPNPPVGALGDKYRPATSEMVIACMSGKRYFDLDAVRTEHKADPTTYTGNGYTKGQPEGVGGTVAMQGNPAGAPPLDWWEIPTAPYRGSHYATYPPALCEKPIKSMAPLKVCQTCGKPSERITKPAEGYADHLGESIAGRNGKAVESGLRGSTQPPGGHIVAASYETVGWTDCSHDNWRPGRVLDIFGGSGTTLAVATGHGRDAIGIDLDARNVDLARERIGPMFFHHVTVDELADLFGSDDGEAAA